MGYNTAQRGLRTVTLNPLNGVEDMYSTMVQDRTENRRLDEATRQFDLSHERGLKQDAQGARETDLQYKIKKINAESNSTLQQSIANKNDADTRGKNSKIDEDEAKYVRKHSQDMIDNNLAFLSEAVKTNDSAGAMDAISNMMNSTYARQVYQMRVGSKHTDVLKKPKIELAKDGSIVVYGKNTDGSEKQVMRFANAQAAFGTFQRMSELSAKGVRIQDAVKQLGGGTTEENAELAARAAAVASLNAALGRPENVAADEIKALVNTNGQSQLQTTNPLSEAQNQQMISLRNAKHTVDNQEVLKDAASVEASVNTAGDPNSYINLRKSAENGDSQAIKQLTQMEADLLAAQKHVSDIQSTANGQRMLSNVTKAVAPLVTTLGKGFGRYTGANTKEITQKFMADVTATINGPGGNIIYNQAKSDPKYAQMFPSPDPSTWSAKGIQVATIAIAAKRSRDSTRWVFDDIFGTDSRGQLNAGDMNALFGVADAVFKGEPVDKLFKDYTIGTQSTGNAPLNDASDQKIREDNHGKGLVHGLRSAVARSIDPNK